MEIRAEKWRVASGGIADFLEEACRSPSGETHWPSVLAAAGALTGEAALMAAERSLPPVGPVFSRRAESWFFSEPQSPATLSGYLRRVMIDGFRIAPEAAPDPAHALRRVGASAGMRPFPPLPPEPSHAPMFWPLNAGPRWRRFAHERAAAQGLSRSESVYAMLGAVIEAMRRARGTLEPGPAGAIAMEAMVAAMRMAPLLEEDRAENSSYAFHDSPFLTEPADPSPFIEEASQTAQAAAAPRRVFGRRRVDQEAGPLMRAAEA